jgi:hypothetical protein
LKNERKREQPKKKNEREENPRSIMAPRAEHDGRVRQAQPVLVVAGQVGDQLADVCVALAGHHEADGEARGVGGGRDEVEAAERAEGTLALEVHVEDYACVLRIVRRAEDGGRGWWW